VGVIYHDFVIQYGSASLEARYPRPTSKQKTPSIVELLETRETVSEVTDKQHSKQQPQALANAEETGENVNEKFKHVSVITEKPTTLSTTKLDCSVHEGKANQFQYIPLLSWPGSGNTWLRFLIEQATGWQTTTVERGDKKLAPFFIGEWDYPLSGKSIVQKTHYFTYVRSWFKEIDTYKLAHSCVLLIRSPLDAFLAEFQRKNTGANHTGFIKPEVFYTVYKRRFQEQVKKWIENEVNAYAPTYLNPIKKSCDKAYHVIFYDELKQNTDEEVEKLVRFLETQHKVPMNVRFSCLKQDHKGHAKRKKQEFDKQRVRAMIPDYLRTKLNDGLDRLNSTLNGRVPGFYKV